MDTDRLRSLIKAAATGTPGARIHPNGLGFDCHGTTYKINEHATAEVRTPVPRGAEGSDRVIWCASRRVELQHDWAVKYGEGSTPAAAKAAAGIGRGRS
jgi:hypothetical protein